MGLYDEDLKIVSDWKFFIRSICKFNASYCRIDQTLSTFYLDGLSSDPKNHDLIVEEKQKVINLEFEAFLNDINCFYEMEKTINSLRITKNIKRLIKFGLLDQF